MTSSTPAQPAARRRVEPHRDGGDLRLNTVRLAMTLPRRPVRGGDVHDRAIERLDAAVDDLEHLDEESDSARGRPDKRTAAVALAAAHERVAAREAWVKYIEQDY